MASGLSDAEPVNILCLEPAFEVEESVEMIPAIDVALSSNEVLRSKCIAYSDKEFKFPVVTRLRIREEDKSGSHSELPRSESLSWDSKSLDLTRSEVGGEYEWYRGTGGLSSGQSGMSSGTGRSPRRSPGSG